MTKKEYISAYRAARLSAGKLTAKTMTELKQTYIDAGKLAAKAARDAELSGLGELDINSWRSIERQLAEGARLINDKLAGVLPKVMGDAAALASSLDKKWLLDTVKDAGGVLSKTAIRDVFVGVNTRVIESTVNRMGQAGYTFSERIWKTADGYQNDLKSMIRASLAQGRDPVKIAGDIQTFIGDGKIQLMKRYGKLKAGTAQFVRRIPVNVDYRAMRLVRTELYASLKEAGVEAGKANPGCTQEFDWIMELGRAHWDCSCPDLAAGGPYTADNIPVQPHPSCACILQPRLMDRREFVADLAKWANGEDVPYIDNWKREYYDKV